MNEHKEPDLLQNDFFFDGVFQIDDKYPFGRVPIHIQAEDDTLRHFRCTMDIPLRDVHKNSVQEDIKDHCIEAARQAFNTQAIIPLLRFRK